MVTEEEKLCTIRSSLENEIITKLKQASLTCDEINTLSSAYSKLEMAYANKIIQGNINSFNHLCFGGYGSLEEDNGEIS